MLSFIKKLFGATEVESTPTPAPYKVEAPTLMDPAPVEKAETPKKKPTVKKATAKPRKPRAPKA